MNAHVGAPSGATISRWSRLKALLLGTLLATASSATLAQETAEPASRQPAWIGKSNAEAQLLLDTYTRFFPEMAGQLGVAEGVRAGLARLAPARLAGFFMLVNASMLVAWAHHLRGERAITWDPTRR